MTSRYCRDLGCLVGEVDHRVVATEIVGDICIGGPVVLPPFTVEEIPEPVRAAGRQRNASKERVAVAFHRIRGL